MRTNTSSITLCLAIVFSIALFSVYAQDSNEDQNMEKRARSFAFAKRAVRPFAFAKRFDTLGFAFAKRTPSVENEALPVEYVSEDQLAEKRARFAFAKKRARFAFA